MKNLALMFLVFSLGCGSKGGGNEDGGGNADGGVGADGGPTPDAPPNCDPVQGTPNLTLEIVAGGFRRPVLVAHPPGDPRLFVVEQHTGQIRIIKDGQVLGTPFLDIDGISTGSEQGLLGLAFHPQYASNGRFFINYTRQDGTTVVEEVRVSPNDPDVADPSTRRQILTQAQFASNHNGGHIAFGPDGYLYIGLGDGGGANDPQDNGERITTLLGKILRIDVDSGDPYGIPQDNPFVGVATAREEIWHCGLRNPWRFSFDRATGDMYIADVGQDAWEEVNVQPAGQGGINYGWNTREGAHDFDNDMTPDCNGVPRTDPVTEYSHGEGCSVTGGHVYRGCKMPGYHGTYFYADYCRGTVRSFKWNGAGGATDETVWSNLDVSRISSFGEDYLGEIYVVEMDPNGGQTPIYKIVPAP